jgi:apolipoprotein D and lipocalin family protein
MKHVILSAGFLCLVAGVARAAPDSRADEPAPLRTVARVDLSRYIGTWYEIASFPQRFQKGCTASMAVYSIREDGQIEVLNRCHRDSLGGRETIARGRARVIDRDSNAKLKVTFFWPFWGDYWIIDLDPEYRWAVVGHPSRKYLWILCRTRAMDPLVYSGILERLSGQGYDVGKLRVTLQPQEPAGP